MNRRVAKKIDGRLVRGYIWQSPTQLLAETDGDGHVLKRFVYASKANSPDYVITDKATYRIIPDQIGSPRLVVNSKTGQVVDEMIYDDFGQMLTLGLHILPMGFAGGLYGCDTHLVRFGARDYDAETGRWLSRDPILFRSGDGGKNCSLLPQPKKQQTPNNYNAKCSVNDPTGEGGPTIGPPPETPPDPIQHIQINEKH